MFFFSLIKKSLFILRSQYWNALHLVSEVGFTNTPTNHRSLKMMTKTLEELTRDQL